MSDDHFDGVLTINCLECGEATSTVIDSWGSDTKGIGTLMYECGACGTITGVHRGTEGEPEPKNIELRCASRGVYEGLYGENRRVYDAERAGRVDLSERQDVDQSEIKGFSLSNGHRARPGEIIILPPDVHDTVMGHPPEKQEEDVFVPEWSTVDNIMLVRGESEVAETMLSKHESFEEDYKHHQSELQDAIEEAEYRLGERWTARVLVKKLGSFEDLGCDEEIAAVEEALQRVLFGEGE